PHPAGQPALWVGAAVGEDRSAVLADAKQRRLPTAAADARANGLPTSHGHHTQCCSTAPAVCAWAIAPARWGEVRRASRRGATGGRGARGGAQKDSAGLPVPTTPHLPATTPRHSLR